MTLFTLTLTCFLALVVSAAPNNSPQCKFFTDNFDNVAAPIVGDTQLGTYNGVTYQAWRATSKNPVTGTTGGVIPHSDGQDLVVGIRNDVTSFGSLTLNPYGNIVAKPSRSFDLYSFWFGCSLNLQSAASIASACVLSVTGFNSADRQVPVQTFSYSPTNPTASGMVLAQLSSSFRDLKNVTIGIASAVGAPVTSGIYIDDVSHCNYS